MDIEIFQSGGGQSKGLQMTPPPPPKGFMIPISAEGVLHQKISSTPQMILNPKQLFTPNYSNFLDFPFQQTIIIQPTDDKSYIQTNFLLLFTPTFFIFLSPRLT